MDVAVLKTPPTSEPVTVADANHHLKVTGEDTYVESLIITARMMVERYLNRSLITQTWTAYSDCWGEGLCLPYPPLISVTHVKYYDLDGVLRTLSSSNYWVNTFSQPGDVKFVYGFTPPELQYGRPNSIEVEYVAGYAEVPEPICHAIKILLTDMYEHRGQYVIGNNANKIPGYIIDLIHTYKMYNV